MKYSKHILLIVVLTVAMGSVAQIRVAQPAYPIAGVSAEPNFSSELALPKVETPSPFTQSKAVVTPKHIYSPATEGTSYNAAELQRASVGKVVSLGGGTGASATVGNTGAVTYRGNASQGSSVPTFSIAPIGGVRKYRDFVSADEHLLASADEDVDWEKRRITILPGEELPGEWEIPVGDIPWLLMLLACAVFVGRKVRKLGS